MPADTPTATSPLCPLFGECGGCQYQDLSYEEELRLKEGQVRALLARSLSLPDRLFSPIVASPKIYHYRSRLDLKLLRTRDRQVFMGFTPLERGVVIEAQACPIAMEALSAFLPRLKQQAVEVLTPKYRNANLVVKTGDDGRVLWGGIGRRSLRVAEDQYLWTDIRDRRVFFSLDTFFQANLSILPKVFDVIRGMDIWGAEVCFYDLYGGVGLFGIGLYDCVGRVVLIEENIHAVKLARYNAAHNGLDRFEIFSGRMEESFNLLENLPSPGNAVLMVDPPRKGLGKDASSGLARLMMKRLIYLSCDPQSLLEDLVVLTAGGWRVVSVTPFDFFPRTRHIETLVLLTRD